MQEHAALAKGYEADSFVLESRVQELLGRKQGDGQRCADELTSIEEHLADRLRELLHRNYPQFIELHGRVESAAQSLLKVKEDATALRSSLQQVGALPFAAPSGAAASLAAERDGGGGGGGGDASGGGAGGAATDNFFLHGGPAGGLYSRRRQARGGGGGGVGGGGGGGGDFTQADLVRLEEDVQAAVFEADYEKATSLILLERQRVEDAGGAACGCDPAALSLRRQLWALENAVVDGVLEALQHTPAASRHLLKLLLRLDRHQAAYDFFFEHRSAWVRGEVRRVRFVGDVVAYARAAGAASFRGLSTTCAEYFSLSQGRQQSGVMRWLCAEIHAFSALMQSQIVSVNQVSEVFLVVAEVCRACRDSLEPLGMDLLPHLHCCLEVPALEALAREADATAQVCTFQLQEDTFAPVQTGGGAAATGDEALFEDVHAPPLFTRSARASERVAATLSASAHGLLQQVAALLNAVRTACLYPPGGEGPAPRSGDRPFLALEAPADRAVAAAAKAYVKDAFERPSAAGRPPLEDREALVLLSSVCFVLRTARRASSVLRGVFHRGRMSCLDHLADQSRATPAKLREAIVAAWCGRWCGGLRPPAEAEETEAKGLLPCVGGLLVRMAAFRTCAAAVFPDASDVSRVGAALVAGVAKAAAGSDLLATPPPDAAGGHKRLRKRLVASVLLLKGALEGGGGAGGDGGRGRDCSKEFAAFEEAWQPSDEEAGRGVAKMLRACDDDVSHALEVLGYAQVHHRRHPQMCGLCGCEGHKQPTCQRRWGEATAESATELEKRLRGVPRATRLGKEEDGASCWFCSGEHRIAGCALFSVLCRQIHDTKKADSQHVSMWCELAACTGKIFDQSSGRDIPGEFRFLTELADGDILKNLEIRENRKTLVVRLDNLFKQLEAAGYVLR